MWRVYINLLNKVFKLINCSNGGSSSMCSIEIQFSFSFSSKQEILPFISSALFWLISLNPKINNSKSFFMSIYINIKWGGSELLAPETVLDWLHTSSILGRTELLLYGWHRFFIEKKRHWHKVYFHIFALAEAIFCRSTENSETSSSSKGTKEEKEYYYKLSIQNTQRKKKKSDNDHQGIFYFINSRENDFCCQFIHMKNLNRFDEEHHHKMPL